MASFAEDGLEIMNPVHMESVDSRKQAQMKDYAKKAIDESTPRNDYYQGQLTGSEKVIESSRSYK